MLNGREILDGYREDLVNVNKLLLDETLSPEQRLWFEQIRRDTIWFITHITEEDCV